MIECKICGLTTFDDDRKLPMLEDPKTPWAPFAFELDCGHYIFDGSPYPTLNGSFVEELDWPFTRPLTRAVYRMNPIINCWQGLSLQRNHMIECISRREKGKCNCWEVISLLEERHSDQAKASHQRKLNHAKSNALKMDKKLKKEKEEKKWQKKK